MTLPNPLKIVPNAQLCLCLAEAMRDTRGAVRCLHAQRMAESAASVVLGERGGAFLRALAGGSDRNWPVDSRARSFAASLREALEDVLGSAACAADLLKVAAFLHLPL